MGKEWFGLSATDKVTGFKGIVMGIIHYATGCDQVLLAPKVDKEGKVQDGQWFDVSRIELGTGKRITFGEPDWFGPNATKPGADNTPKPRFR